MEQSQQRLDWRAVLVFLPFTAFLVSFFFINPISQNDHYHYFADDRFFLFPNSQNVLSNLIFMFVGYYAALEIDFSKFSRKENIYLLTLIVGIFFTGFGSVYYHLVPNTQTLFWDRLPMSLGFAGFTAWILSKTAFKGFKSKDIDFVFFVILFFSSLGSVVYWHYSQQSGAGDLRPYFTVQFGSILTTLMIVLLYDKNLYPQKACLSLFGFYVLAKIVETFDKPIFEMSHQIVSGHTLKHLTAGFGCYLFLYYLKKQS